MTFNATLLPRVEKAGGGCPPSLAAGRHIIVACGDLSARRPGSERTRKPVRLPAERLRRGAFLISRHAGRRLARRDLVAGIVSRVRSGSDAGALNHGRSAPLNFSGSARVFPGIAKAMAEQWGGYALQSMEEAAAHPALVRLADFVAGRTDPKTEEADR